MDYFDFPYQRNYEETYTYLVNLFAKKKNELTYKICKN